MRRCHFLGLHFFSPWKPDSLLCLLCIHFLLPSHLTQRDGDFFLSWRSVPGSASLPGIRSSPWSSPGWVLACREPCFVCCCVCLRVRTDGGRDPRGGVASSQRHPGGLDTSSPPPLFVPLAGAVQPDAASTWEAGQGCRSPPGPASPPAPPPGFSLSTFKRVTGGGLGKQAEPTKRRGKKHIL